MTTVAQRWTRAWLSVAVGTAVVVAGCTATDGAVKPPSQSQPSQSASSEKSCQHGTGDDRSPLAGQGDLIMNGLVFRTSSSPLHTGQTIKFVWRVTGTGPAKFTATGPSGSTIRPDWGPESHASSNFRAPGDEWGMGFTFPTPGCWIINVSRRNDHSQAGVSQAGVLIAAR